MMLANDLKTYYDEVRRYLDCPKDEQDRLLLSVNKQVIELQVDNPNLDYDGIVEFLGEPESLAASLMERLSPDVIQKFRKRKRHLRMSAIVCIAAIVIVLSTVLIYTTSIQFKSDLTEENTIIMKDFFYDGYNVKIRFTTNDILNPLIEMDEQTFASTAEAFGTNYGDGYLHLYQSSSGVSYYSTCEQFIFQYFTLYVPGMAGNNVVGTFASAIEWISNDEAKRLYLEGSMLVSETVKTDFEKK